MSKHTRLASTRTAAIAALALVVAGLPAAAQASTERPAGSDRPARSSAARGAASAPAAIVASTAGTISGTVEIPAGADPADARIYVDAFTYDSSSGKWVFDEDTHVWVEPDLRNDGSFELTGLEVGREYRIRADVYDVPGYLTGFYAGPDTSMVRAPEAGAPVRPAATGLRLVPMAAASISGPIDLPEGFFDGGVDSIELSAYELDDDGVRLWSSDVFVGAGDTEYSIDVYPHSDYVLEVFDFSSRVPTGYYHAGVDGLVAEREHATHVPAGSRVNLVVGTSLVEPRLTSVTAPQLLGNAVVGETLTASTGRWSLRGATFTYQWLRDGTAIAGAVRTGYRLTPRDAGTRIAVRVTATFPGLPSPTATATSAATSAVAKAPAPRATKAPRLAGTARFAKKLRVTSGAWSLPGATVSYQWLRAGKPIKGATKRAYKLKKKDVGKRLAVRVTAQVPGHDDGVWTSSAKKVKKAKATLKVKAKAVKASKRPKVVVRVKAGSLAKPRGTVRVKYGKQTIRVKLRAKDRGKVVVRLPRLDKGKHRLVVRYQPAAQTKKFVTKAKVTKVTLRVR